MIRKRSSLNHVYAAQTVHYIYIYIYMCVCVCVCVCVCACICTDLNPSKSWMRRAQIHAKFNCLNS